MSTHAELRPPPAEEVGEQRSFIGDIWATISTEEFAVRVFVTAAVTLSVGWLGIKEAVAGIIAAQVLNEAVKNFVRRRKLTKKKLWLLTLLLLLIDRAQRAWAAVADRFGLKRRRPRRAAAGGARGAAIMAAAATGLTVAAITVPEVALGHQLVGHRRTTFFSTSNLSGFRLSLPHPGAVEATGADGARVVYSVSATSGVLHCSRASGSIFPIGTTTVTCVARARGATRSGSFAVTVVDSEGPKLQLPSAIDRKILGRATSLTFVAIARDRVDGRVAVRCSPRSGATYNLGKTTVTCSAADSHGNTTTRSFVVDLTRAPPGSIVFALPANPLVEATGPNGAVVTYTASAKYGSGRSVSVTCTPRSGSTLSIGAHSVTCSAHGQQQSFNVTVRDSTGPAIDIKASPSIEAESKDGAPLAYTVTATDKVSGTVTPTCDPASGTTLAIGTHSIACTAKDGAGNATSRSFTVKVVDGPPTLTVSPDITRPYQKPSYTVVRYQPATATDKVDGALTPTCSPQSGSGFPFGKTVVTCTVTDSAGNQVSKSFTVAVVDTVPPNLTIPKDFVAYTPYEVSTAVVNFKTSAYDTVDGVLPVSCSPASGSSFPIGKNTVTCSATDRSGNKTTKSFVVTVYPGIG